MLGPLKKLLTKGPASDWPGIITVGKCKSGVNHSLTDSPALGCLGLASPLAWQILVGEPNALRQFQKALGKQGQVPPDHFFHQGMTAEIFHGRQGEVRYGVYVSHQLVEPVPDVTPDGKPALSLPPLTDADRVFARLVEEEAALYNEAKALVYSLASAEGRQVFFGLAGVYAEGLELLDWKLYSSLLFLIKNSYQDAFLSEISRIEVVKSRDDLESSQDGRLIVSIGRLAKVNGRCLPANLDLSAKLPAA